MSETYSEKICEFDFPEMESLSEAIGPENEITDVIENEVKVSEKSIEELKQKEMEEEAKNAVAKLESDLLNAKNEYEKKISLINSIIGKLENPLSLIDDEMLELIHYIIKKSVKNLIYKEIKTDSKLINRIVRELAELIHAKNGMLMIHLSEADYSRLKDKSSEPNMTYKINPTLSEGDIIVESNYSEIKSILNERLNQILGVKYA